MNLRQRPSPHTASSKASLSSLILHSTFETIMNISPGNLTIGKKQSFSHCWILFEGRSSQLYTQLCSYLYGIRAPFVRSAAKTPTVDKDTLFSSSTLIKWMGFIIRLQITLSSVSANILHNLSVSNALFISILFTTCYHNVFRLLIIFSLDVPEAFFWVDMSPMNSL